MSPDAGEDLMNIPVTADVRVNYDEVRAIVDRAIADVAEAIRTMVTLGNVGLWIPGDFPDLYASDHLRQAHRALQVMRHTLEATTPHA